MHRPAAQPLVVLMSVAAHERLGRRLRSLGIPIRCVLLDATGTLTTEGKCTSAAEADVEVIWAGSDAIIEGLFPALAAQALASAQSKWFQSGSAGVDNPLFGRLLRQGIRVTACHAPAEAVADFVIAGVLDHFQRGPERRQARLSRSWLPLPFREISGTKWLIIGFGAIGRAVARRARAFGAEVIGLRRTLERDPLAQAIVSPGSLHGILPDADVVVLAVPLTQQTTKLADVEFLRRMKSRSVLVNVSRGDVVDEPALLDALRAGIPDHAILDVCSVEPAPSDHPFWVHPQIALTAHLAGMGSGVIARSDELFVENLTRFASGSPLMYEVPSEETQGATAASLTLKA